VRIATFGDLHLGPSMLSDRFLNDEEHLLRFDDHLRESHDRIILMGDIFQTDYGSRPGSRSEVLEAAMERYPRISYRWKSSSCAMIYGNHDVVTERRMSAVKEIFLKDKGSRIWLTHGHQFDPLISQGPVPFIFSWMVGKLRRLGQKRLADFLEGRFFMACQRMARSLGSPRYAARNALMLDQYDIVIMGHTHQPECVRVGSGIYANLGACLPNQLGYVSIDTLTKEVQLREFQGNNGSRGVLSPVATQESICTHSGCWDV
jgi:UDP-2,3-diacylglucosamine pyrophosphatase LpxH